MRTAFFKAIRWFIVCMLVMGGTTALMIAETTGGMGPVIFGVIGYGLAYVMTALWKEMKGKVLAWGMGTFIVITHLCDWFDMLVTFLTGTPIVTNKYFVWFVAVGLLGIPFMTYIYRKLDR